MATTKVVSWNQRLWATREFQRFCGRFELDEFSGLYFDCETFERHRHLISKTFPHVPTQLRQAAYSLSLTVSTTRAPQTLLGDQSAVYGAWDRPVDQISPHLEMSESSLIDELILPHLVHESSHLFWAIQSKVARECFQREMIELAEHNQIEVTLYAQRFFNAWHTTKATSSNPEQIRRALEKWVVESFCETLGKVCCPWYKQEEQLVSTNLLHSRYEAISAHFGLLVESQQKQSFVFST